MSFKPGVELVLEAFDGYWRKAPAVKRLVMRSHARGDDAGRPRSRPGEVDVAYLPERADRRGYPHPPRAFG